MTQLQGLARRICNSIHAATSAVRAEHVRVGRTCQSKPIIQTRRMPNSSRPWRWSSVADRHSGAAARGAAGASVVEIPISSKHMLGKTSWYLIVSGKISASVSTTVCAGRRPRDRYDHQLVVVGGNQLEQLRVVFSNQQWSGLLLPCRACRLQIIGRPS